MPLSVMLGSLYWTDAADDAILNQKFLEFCDWAENTARGRGLLTDFVYMNYALGSQDVLGGIGKENLSRMRKIKNTYDPHNLFGKYWKGGYKL